MESDQARPLKIEHAIESIKSALCAGCRAQNQSTSRTQAQLKFEGADIAGGEGAGGGRDEGVRSVLGVGRRAYATNKGPQ